MRVLNNPYPWESGLENPLSMVDLMAVGTVPPEIAATFWWAVERGASFFTAGGPSGAGKSTLANSLLAFLPDDAWVYVVSGRDDTFQLPTATQPTYLLISELSSHGRPFYLSGPAALRAFAMLRTGVRAIGTLHAESVEEAVTDVLSDEMAVPDADIARLTFIAIIRVDGPRDQHGRVERRRADLTRRVIEVGLLRPGDGGVEIVNLAAWNQGTGVLETAAPAGVAALAAWAGTDMVAVETAIRARTAILNDLLGAGRRSPDDVAAAVHAFRTRG